MNEEGKYLNDVHVLDTTLFSWSRPKTKGPPMKARGYHTAVRVGAKIVFFGGIGKCNWALKEIYSLDTTTWSVATAGQCPPIQSNQRRKRAPSLFPPFLCAAE